MALLVGEVFLFHPMLLSGFRRTVGGFDDARLVNVFLEHTFLWFQRDAGHLNLWSPPFFFPEGNVGAYSELMLGASPVYWVWRLLCFKPDTAFQLWLLSVSALNFGAAYAWLRQGLRLPAVASTVGAFLAAFGGIRAAQLHHPQLLPQFFSFFALFFLCRAISVDKAQRTPWLAAFFAAVVGQIYASFYLGWFLVFALACGLLTSLALRQERRVLLGIAKDSWPPLLILGSIAIGLASPLVIHGLAAIRSVGVREYREVIPLLPSPQSWLYMGRRSLLYYPVRDWAFFTSIPAEHEQRLGLGLLTSACVAAGLWRARRRPWVPVVGITSLTVIVLSTSLGGFSLWRVVYEIVPGAAALRAVTRIAFTLLPVAGAGLAMFWLDSELPKWRHVLVAMCALEQINAAVSYPKELGRDAARSVSVNVRSDCAAYFYAPQVTPGSDGSPRLYQIDAMVAQQLLGVPTVNGYSGSSPSGFGDLRDNVWRTETDRQRLEIALRGWERAHGLEPDTVCMVADTQAPY